MNKIRIGTLFSGIGAAEFALKRLGIPHEIVFACDNGEIMLKEEDAIIEARLAELTTIAERKQYINSLIPKKTNFVKQSYMRVCWIIKRCRQMIIPTSLCRQESLCRRSL